MNWVRSVSRWIPISRLTLCFPAQERITASGTMPWPPGVTDGIRLFVDGQQVANEAAAAFRPTTSEPWYIGAADAGQSGLFKGDLDEAAIWKRQLTSAEVQSLYNSGSGRVISMGPVISEFQPRK